jgi:2-keto-4-pentenoate hydratase
MDPAKASALAEGMRAQLEAFHHAVASGVPRLGWKVAFNAPAIQARLGLSGPCVGALDGTALRRHPATCAAQPEQRLHVEPEIAIRIGEDVAGDASDGDVEAAIAAIAPALELADFARPRDDLRAMAAHAFFHVGTVLGAELPAARLAEMGAEHPRLEVGGRPAVGPDPALALGDLTGVVRHVARTLHDHGEQLRRGDIIMSGALVPPQPLSAGEVAVADFGVLGRVQVTCAAAGACGFADTF